MKMRITLFVVLFLLSGCAGMARLRDRIEAIYGGFEDYTVDTITGNVLVGRPPLDTARVELNAQESRSKDGKIFYSLIVDYTAVDWLFIKEGESLVLLIDEQQVGLKGKGSSSHRGIDYDGWKNEKAWYGFSFEGLDMIANAKEVKVRIIGTQRHVDRYFSEENFKNFRRFVR